MTIVFDPGISQFYPQIQLWGSDFSTSSAETAVMDAAGEETFLMGPIFIDGRPASAKTISSAGGKIHFLPGTTTFANAGTTLRVGIQDVDATTGTPARGDGTFDVYDDLVGATDTITSDTYKTVTMSSGTKSITHGDIIAISFSMTARGGADSVRLRGSSSGDALRFWPQITVNAPAATYTSQLRFPNAVIEFDDGTLGWIYGTVPVTGGATTVTYDSGTTPDEYGSTVKFTRPVTIDGLWGFIGAITLSGSIEAILYSDPLGTPAAVSGGTITIDPDMRNANGNAMWSGLFAAPITLAANTKYGICFRPTTADDMRVFYYTFSSANFQKALPGGTDSTYITRTDNTGVFTETTTRRLLAGVLLAGGDDASGGGGGLAANPLRGFV